MLTTSKYALAALLLLTVALVPIGCSPRQAPVPAPVRLKPSVPGTYTAGSTITLANDAQIVVPRDWRASLNTTGAYVDSPRAEGGIPGCGLLPTSGGMMRSITFSVMGPHAGLASDIARLEAIYRTSSHDASSPVPFTRGPVAVSAPASATGFASERHRMAGILEVSAIVEYPDRRPVFVASALQGLPDAMRTSSDEGLPAALLQFLGFRWH